jgi:hypothetical protein
MLGEHNLTPPEPPRGDGDAQASRPDRLPLSSVGPEVRHNAMPMHARRPHWLTEAIDAEFADSAAAADGYRSHWTEPDYTFAGHSAIELIAGYRHAVHGDGPLRILDVGTGAGAFITQNQWQRCDVVQGITAIDYRGKPEFAEVVPLEGDPRYVVGNAEYLDALEGLEQHYDVVVSKRTAQHFVDMLGSLEQLANRVAPAGLLCVDIASGGVYGSAGIARLLEANGFSPLGPSGRTGTQRDLVMARDAHPRPVAFGLAYSQGSFVEWEAALGRPLTRRERRRYTLEYVNPR